MSNIIRNMLFQFVEFLKRNSLLNALLVAGYSYFIVFMHPAVVEVSINIMNSLSLEVYNYWIKIISVAIMMVLSYVILHQIWHQKEKRGIKLFFLITTVTLMAIHAITMFEMNIEIIHGLMYGILTLLLFPLTGRYATAIIYALPVMLYDEWYQYILLYPDYVQYYELNDIIMDLLGSGLMIAILFSFDILPFKNNKPILKRLEWYVIPVLIVATVFIIASCYVAIYPKDVCNNTVFVLNKLSQPELFWQIHPFTKAKYHVLSIGEALILIATLCYGYAMLDVITKTKN